ncbi:uncharacterized protein LOC128221743 [Mya arenaria]|uniref:uncharacterized protein LOC128221743 n=1 Tax=Mya arenaria TaxID=6604 RepID=UPI0022E85A83|nr:uncharacterized protein LOC128221743 [Mya arenaria]
MKNELVYMKSQSMRNNLIFGGIEEGPEEKQADTEVKFREFLKSKLNLAQELVTAMKIERAHRIGAHNQNGGNPRPRNIVCKFTEFKDRETARKQGRQLKGTTFFISEQFPAEIMEARRRLLPKLNAAKQAGKRTWLVYDTLYVNGSPVTSD